MSQDADTLPFSPTPSGGPTLKVFADRKLCYTAELSGPIELGRQRQDEPAPYTVQAADGARRLVIAPLGDRRISRRHALIEVVDGTRVRLRNTSAAAEVRVDGAESIPPGGEQVLSMPLLLSLGSRLIRVEHHETPERLATLGRQTIPPGQVAEGPERFRDVLAASGAKDASDKLIQWLRSTMEVFQSAASAPDFLARAVDAVVSIVDLSAGAILEPDGGEWRVRQTRFAEDGFDPADWQPSRRMLDSVRDSKTTCRYEPSAQQFGGDVSQPDIVSMVAAPILDAGGNLVGVLYGEQRCDPSDIDDEDDEGTVRAPIRPTGKGHAGIGELEAMLVELLASGVAAGLARLEQEQAAVAAQVRFEQFFTPNLARQLRADDQLLEGRDALVTILFCDIRGFSRIAEAAGPEKTLAWVHDVMGELSECVVAEEGVLVDYQGDGLMAMWGAPVAHPDQALRACRAGQRMLRVLPEINTKWLPQLDRETRVGIGINTGVARVGNIGSRRKFKYGPLGNAVNMAARVQTATKQVGVDLMLTGQTAESLPADAPLRKLCEVQVVNINEPATLYEMPAEDTPQWREIAAKYEEALALASQAKLRPAARTLGNLVAAHPDETPSLKLLSRVVDAMTDPNRSYEAVWGLREK